MFPSWYGGAEGFDAVESSLEARKEPEGNGIEFHVAMTSWTLRDMEELIVQAAAQQIVGRLGKEPLGEDDRGQVHRAGQPEVQRRPCRR
jgi:hypothetical protein